VLSKFLVNKVFKNGITVAPTTQSMNLIVSKLGTKYSTPEVVIINQGDDSSDGMYFITMGDCAVNIIDENR
jgi:hypothetical protein